ncbi:MAG: DUF4097 family beta strand repeat protein [Candidatus Zixiibacteriota bacterium]|nr:MAG: DUF4097 family beta strand repeat protein [candidate division Zixibacteria bacterium]
MTKVLTVVLFPLIIFWSAGGAVAQSTVPPEEVEDPWDESLIILDKAKLLAAKDYEDFIHRLENLAYDYQTYYSEFSNYYAMKYQAELQKLIIRINEGRYCADVDRLTEDLREMARKFDVDRESLEGVPDRRSLLKLNKALHRDLELLEEELREDLAERLLKEETSRKLIQAYLIEQRKSLKETQKILVKTLKEREHLIIQIEHSLKTLEHGEKDLTEEELEVLEQLEELQEEIALIVVPDIEGLVYEVPVPVIVVPPAEAEPLPPKEPLAPAPPVVITGKDRIFVHSSGKRGVAREFADSIEVKSPSYPIYVWSETGNVNISGWDQPKLRVRFDVEIVADSKTSAKAFADDIEVKLYTGEDGIYVKSHFPNLSDPKRKVTRSFMDIRVPRANLVTCENSFGEIVASGLLNGVRISSNYCEVVIDEVSGEIKTANKMGAIKVSRSPGIINLKNSLGPISVIDCRADLDIENSYAPVEIDGCAGALLIRNTGQVEVNDHAGRVEIDNSNGLVQVSDLRGDLFIKNAFRPLVISDVAGSAQIRNMNSNIDAHDIRGELKAFNKFGMISTSDISGPIEITNENGRVMLTAYDRLSGPSFIKADFSQISLTLSESSDILLTAVTEDGTIKTSAAGQVLQRDRVAQTEIAYGRARNKLDVSGTKATIVINEKK